MTQYYITEIRQLANGDFEHQVHFAWDEDPVKARLKADSKYYELLSTAAVSNTKKHSAILFTEESVPLLWQCYTHELEEASE